MLILLWIVIIAQVLFLVVKKHLLVSFDDIDLSYRNPELWEKKFGSKNMEKKAPKWELLLMNSNHMNVPPYTLLKTSSFELASYLMNNMQHIFRDMGYKSFEIHLKSDNGGVIIRKGDSSGAV